MDHQLEAFKSSLPTHIYTTNDLALGLHHASSDYALRNKYIEFNPKNSINYLAFDIDRAISPDEITDDLNLPPPTFFIQNPANRHAHVIYALETAVHLNENSSQKAIRYAAVIESAYACALDADLGYASLIIKNPTHNAWLTYSCRSEPYSLSELAEYVDLKPVRSHNLEKAENTVGLGRNCSVFDDLRHWAYQNIDENRAGGTYEQWLNNVRCKANEYNIFPIRLPESEINSIVKSVASWTWSKYTGKGGKNDVNKGRDVIQGALLGDLREKQALSAVITNRQRVSATEQKMANAIMRIEASGAKITQASVSKMSGLGIATVKRHWHKRVNSNSVNQK